MPERKRDLSGFGAPPPPPAPSAGSARPGSGPPPPPAPPVEPPKRTSAFKKKRITLSLPTPVAVALRRTAEQEGRFYLDLIMDAFEAHGDDIEEDLSGHGRLPRRRAAGRTQIPLNIMPDDLATLDARAKAVELDRSAYVTELLTRSLT